MGRCRSAFTVKRKVKESTSSASVPGVVSGRAAKRSKRTPIHPHEAKEVQNFLKRLKGAISRDRGAAFIDSNVKPPRPFHPPSFANFGIYEILKEWNLLPITQLGGDDDKVNYYPMLVREFYANLVEQTKVGEKRHFRTWINGTEIHVTSYLIAQALGSVYYTRAKRVHSSVVEKWNEKERNDFCDRVYRSTRSMKEDNFSNTYTTHMRPKWRLVSHILKEYLIERSGHNTSVDYTLLCMLSFISSGIKFNVWAYILSAMCDVSIRDKRLPFAYVITKIAKHECVDLKLYKAGKFRGLYNWSVKEKSGFFTEAEERELDLEAGHEDWLKKARDAYHAPILKQIIQRRKTAGSNDEPDVFHQPGPTTMVNDTGTGPLTRCEANEPGQSSAFYISDAQLSRVLEGVIGPFTKAVDQRIFAFEQSMTSLECVITGVATCIGVTQSGGAQPCPRYGRQSSESHNDATVPLNGDSSTPSPTHF